MGTLIKPALHTYSNLPEYNAPYPYRQEYHIPGKVIIPYWAINGPPIPEGAIVPVVKVKYYYPENVTMTSIDICFGKSTSHNYKQAVDLARKFPSHRLMEDGDDLNWVFLRRQEEYYTYRVVLQKLLFLASRWKSCQIVINGEVVPYNAYREFDWTLHERLKHCPWRSELPPLPIVDDGILHYYVVRGGKKTRRTIKFE